MTTNTTHTFTPATDDVRTWLEQYAPEGDLTVAHTNRCDVYSCGDECIGGCPVIEIAD